MTFVHVFEPPAEPSGPVLLLLHGTGGNEHDLVTTGRRLNERAGLLSPRGQVLEHGMPRFFRRLAEGVFDLEDLQVRTQQLADFVREASAHYGFEAGKVTAVGFSNGANIAASLLLLSPGTLAGAVLFRAMVPIVPERLPRLPKTPVFLSNGRTDQLIDSKQTDRLVELLSSAGADVTLAWQPGGHGLTQEDVTQAAEWLDQKS